MKIRLRETLQENIIDSAINNFKRNWASAMQPYTKEGEDDSLYMKGNAEQQHFAATEAAKELPNEAPSQKPKTVKELFQNIKTK